MIKQLTFMFLAGVVVSLILQSHQLGLFYEDGGSFFRIIFYVAGYSLAILAASLILAVIPRAIYWVFRIKKSPKLIAIGWCVWVLIIMVLAGNQLYKISTHQEPVSIGSGNAHQVVNPAESTPKHFKRIIRA